MAFIYENEEGELLRFELESKEELCELFVLWLTDYLDL
jgi:hypothetical protein